MAVWLRYSIGAAVLAAYVLTEFAGENFGNMTYKRGAWFAFTCMQIVATVALASMMKIAVNPTFIGKRADGSVPFYVLLLYPYFVWIQVVVVGVGKMIVIFKGRNKVDLIFDNVWVGDWFGSLDVCPKGKNGEPQKWAGVLDLTNEMPRLNPAAADGYLNIQCWDGTPARTVEIRQAVDQLQKWMKKGPVLIHCAFGKGRSATLCVALVLAVGKAKTVDDAIAFVKKSRPQIRINKIMRSVLDVYFANLGKAN